MDISRRTFVASVAATAGALALPAHAALPTQYVKVTGPVFARGLMPHIDRAWLKQCVLESVWQFDPRGVGGRPLIRHPMTGLTYVVFPKTVGGPAVQQIAATCCKCREDLDPEQIVAHAARYAASQAIQHRAVWTEEHPGVVYLRFVSGNHGWPRLKATRALDAPPIVVTALEGALGDGEIPFDVDEMHAPFPEAAPPKIRRPLFLHVNDAYGNDRRTEQMALMAPAWDEFDLNHGIPDELIKACSYVAYACPVPFVKWTPFLGPVAKVCSVVLCRNGWSQGHDEITQEV